MEERRFEPGGCVIKEGGPGDFFYVTGSGELEVSLNFEADPPIMDHPIDGTGRLRASPAAGCSIVRSSGRSLALERHLRQLFQRSLLMNRLPLLETCGAYTRPVGSFVEIDRWLRS